MPKPMRETSLCLLLFVVLTACTEESLAKKPIKKYYILKAKTQGCEPVCD